MKHVVLISICLTFTAGSQLLSQTPDSSDSIFRLSDKAVNNFLNQSFRNIATGQDEAVNLANYGALDITNGAFKLNLAGPFLTDKKGRSSFFNISTGGRIVGDHLGVLFNNSKFNSGMQFAGKLHIPIGRNTIQYSLSESRLIQEKLRRLQIEQHVASRNILSSTDTNYLNAQAYNHIAKLYTLETESATARQNLTILHAATRKHIAAAVPNHRMIDSLTDSSVAVARQLDKLFADSLLTAHLLDSLGKLKKVIVADLGAPLPRDVIEGNYVKRKLRTMEKAFEEKRIQIEQSLPIPASSFLWLTLTGEINRTKYYSYYDSLPFEQEFSENKFTKSAFGVELNYMYYNKNFNTAHYTNIGVSRLGANNVDDLTTSELSRTFKSALDDSSKTISNKYNVYTEPITGYEAIRIYVNYYFLFGKESTFAFHVFPDVELRATDKNPFNVGVGLVFSFKNKKDNTVANAEFYTQWIDVGRALPQDEQLILKRNQIGLRFGLPFGIPFKK